MIAIGAAGFMQAPAKVENKFTVYWIHGQREVLTGNTIEEAFTSAGYGNGALRAVDFYMPGDCTKYVYNRAKHEWDRKQ